MSENSIRGEYFKRLLTLQTQMEGGSIETRVIIEPPNGNTNTEGKPKVILIQTLLYSFLNMSTSLTSFLLRPVNTWHLVTTALFMGRRRMAATATMSPGSL